MKNMNVDTTHFTFHQENKQQGSFSIHIKEKDRRPSSKQNKHFEPIRSPIPGKDFKAHIQQFILKIRNGEFHLDANELPCTIKNSLIYM